MEIRYNKDLGENGLYTGKAYTKNEVIFVLDGKVFDKPTRESIYVGDGKHIHDKFGQYINHSFNPTVYIDGNKVKALKDIELDVEITFNYNENEINMACPFIVDGTKVCGKNI
jgi:hypothetical protein